VKVMGRAEAELVQMVRSTAAGLATVMHRRAMAVGRRQVVEAGLEKPMEALRCAMDMANSLRGLLPWTVTRPHKGAWELEVMQKSRLSARDVLGWRRRWLSMTWFVTCLMGRPTWKCGDGGSRIWRR
jgi:hypothetical protein